MHKRRGLPVVIVQPAGVIGPNDFLKSALGISYSLMMRNLLIFSMPGAYNFVDVRDVVSGIIAAGEKGRIGDRYILSGNIVTIKQKKQTIDKILSQVFTVIRVRTKILSRCENKKANTPSSVYSREAQYLR